MASHHVSNHVSTLVGFLGVLLRLLFLSYRIKTNRPLTAKKSVGTLKGFGEDRAAFISKPAARLSDWVVSGPRRRDGYDPREQHQERLSLSETQAVAR